MCRVVLVVAVVLLGRGPRTDPGGGCVRRSLRLVRSLFSPAIPGVCMPCATVRTKVYQISLRLPNSMYSVDSGASSVYT